MVFSSCRREVILPARQNFACSDDVCIGRYSRLYHSHCNRITPRHFRVDPAGRAGSGPGAAGVKVMDHVTSIFSHKSRQQTACRRLPVSWVRWRSQGSARERERVCVIALLSRPNDVAISCRSLDLVVYKYLPLLASIVLPNCKLFLVFCRQVYYSSFAFTGSL